MATLAFLGTGLIGGGLARAAAGRGETVRAYNRTPAKAEALAAHGVTPSATVAGAVAGAERVHLALSDDAAVEAVLREAVGALPPGAAVVDHTTASVAGTKARAERLAAEGVAYLHAPVFMSPAMCLDGTGLMLAAGPKAVYDAVEAGLAAMTGRVRYLGERPDLAAAFKLFGNAMLLSVIGGLSDVLTMAAAHGVEASQVLELFAAFDPGNVLRSRGPRMAAGRYEASFELSMARKDARLMIEAADGRPLAVLPGLAARMDALLEAGFADRDVGVLSVEAVPEADPE